MRFSGGFFWSMRFGEYREVLMGSSGVLWGCDWFRAHCALKG
jgi:hypothetical protein